MNISYHWLSEYIDLSGVTAEELAEKLTRTGIEVDSVESRNKGVSQVVVGEVKACEQHPNADRLKVCQVDVGQEELLQIVCGAPNVAAGQKVPVALVGASLPDLKIKRAKLRGVESQGMICSAKELGMNDKLLAKEFQEGILVLPDDAQIGTDVAELLSLHDEVLELDLTPNRSDCLSMIGAAYEAGAILDRKVNLPQAEINETERTISDFKVSISEPELCTHYAARRIRNVKIGSSPLWMQNRLMAAGIRPINNVVDITNYVMLEYGQPLHAFDAEKLAGSSIHVRLANEGERFVTLDDVERTLSSDMLLITDAEKPVAIAGVMGGAEAEVTEQTTQILLESARFSGDSVRRTSKALGLRSESSIRFEKNVDPAGVIAALNRAASLIEQYASGEVDAGIAEAGSPQTDLVRISISKDRINSYLGTQISTEEVSAIFDRLGFEYEAENDQWTVTVPSRRGDITRDVDLIEEVARLYGYDNIPTTWISGVTTPGSLTKEQKIAREIRRYMTDRGLHEAINYTLTHPHRIAQFEGLFPGAEPVKVSMPMSEDRSVLRTSQLPLLIEAVMHNRNRNIHDAALFEMGQVYIAEQQKLTDLPNEPKLLSGVWTGAAAPAHWSKTERPVDFYDVKGLIDGLFAYLGIESVRYEAEAAEGFHPGKTAAVYFDVEDGPKKIGRIGQLHPQLQEEFELGETYMFELELQPVFEQAVMDIQYEQLPRYPSAGRDLAMVVDADLEASKMLDKIKEVAGPLLESVSLFDVYQGDNIEQGKKSLAMSLVYRDRERTLTDEEVSELHEKIVHSLEKAFAAKLR